MATDPSSGLVPDPFQGDTLICDDVTDTQRAAAQRCVERLVPEGRCRIEILAALGLAEAPAKQAVTAAAGEPVPSGPPRPVPAPKPRAEVVIQNDWTTYTGFVDAEPARAYVRQLVDAGMTQAAIARAAHWDDSNISRLLHGDFQPGRPPVRAIREVVSARLLAVRLELPPPMPKRVKPCPPGTVFTPAGYRVGRCADCGRLAATHMVAGGREQLMSHPPLDVADEAERAA